MRPDVIVVGAGVSGLSCARRLVEAGASVLVVDRAKGVGGRCATRHVDGLPIDFGVVFLHGQSPAFVREIEGVEGATKLVDWPARRHDTGMPCQPDAFGANERRLAYVEGVSAFPKHLARGLSIELRTDVRAVTAVTRTMRVETTDGRVLEAPTVVLALAPEQPRELLETVGMESPELAAAGEVLRMFTSRSSVAVLCGYPLSSPVPPWDVSYPSDSPVLLMVSNESTKRPGRRQNALVFQTTPRWSRKHIDDPLAELETEILAEAGRRLGPWAAEPSWAQVHLWRYARLDRGNELATPLLFDLPGGGRLGVAGEVFAPGGGVEAAWMSGRALGERIRERVPA